MYDSPNSQLFESAGVGFRGMSGSAVLCAKTDNFVGMLIRRGVDLGTKYVDMSNTTYNFTQSSSTVPRAMIMGSSLMESHIAQGGSLIRSIVKN
jgi:hypothetical protein